MRKAAADDGIGVPDAAVRTVLDGIPAFQSNGSFDKAKFAQVLRQNGLSENEFINEIKDEVISRQLITPIINGAQVPDEMLGQIFGLLGEQRTASLVNVPVNTQPVPAMPSDDVLQRYWRNHQSQFTSPEYRKIQLVILSLSLIHISEPTRPY